MWVFGRKSVYGRAGSPGGEVMELHEEELGRMGSQILSQVSRCSLFCICPVFLNGLLLRSELKISGWCRISFPSDDQDI